jgi:hypothetical protein
MATNFGSAAVTTTQIAAGGAERESIESIRYFAPKSLQIQERAVTTSDYEILLKTQYPEIQAVAAYGGEDLEPPQFGKVAISVYLGQGQESLSNTLSNTYIEYLKERSPLAIEPIFVATKFMYGCAIVDLYYNPKLTRKSTADIETLARNAIVAYNTQYLDDFNTKLRVSALSSAIDAVDISVVSNEISVMPYIEFSPALNVALNPSFKFVAKLIKPYPFDEDRGFATYKPAIKSGVFSYNGQNVYLQDDGVGNIQIITSDVANPKVVKPSIGTVNYDTGEVNLVGFIADSYSGAGIKIMASTSKNDITAPNGRIFTLKDIDVTINLIESK